MTDLSSERAPQKWQDCNFEREKKKSMVKSPIIQLNTKTYWLTDRHSQCDFDFDFDFEENGRSSKPSDSEI
jgi:hypothetical protein